MNDDRDLDGEDHREPNQPTDATALADESLDEVTGGGMYIELPPRNMPPS